MSNPVTDRKQIAAMKTTQNPDSRQTSPSVVILGGGLAGIAAAIRLARSGVGVTLVETRKRLGGRATSFVDPSTGQVVDNCQHVLLGCCTNLMELYGHLGVLDRIRWYRRLFFWDGDGPIDTLEADDLPAPFHLTRSLMGFGSLTVSEKCAIARAMWTIIGLDRSQAPRLERISFAQWLREQRQPRGAMEQFWATIVAGAVNETADRVNAAYAIHVFQEGFLCSERGYVMGLPTVPLVELYDQALRIITDSGGRVLLSTGAERFVFDGRVVTALRLTDSTELSAPAFISAVPFDRLLKLCPASMLEADPRLGRLDQIDVSPIIGIHFWFSASPDSNGRSVMALPHLILTRSPLHWIFNKGIDEGAGIEGQRVHHLHGVISGAHDLVGQPADAIIEMALGEVRKALAATGGDAAARLVHARVIKEKRATFSATPGIDALRPAAAGEIENLFLAGDWCRTGWPATMEGAVRSGYQAAGAVWAGLNPHAAVPQILVADLPTGRLYRCLDRLSAKGR